MTVEVSDLLVIGAGLAGLSAASAAVRRGLSVTLVSALQNHPADFRGEKFGEEQLAALDRMGLGAAARAHMTVVDGCWAYRYGRLVERRSEREFSSRYPDLVNALASALPREMVRITGRIAAVETSENHQTVVLADGRRFSARLVAVATGLGSAIHSMLGVERRVLSASHSLSLGFDLAEPAGSFGFPSLVWGREPDARLSYLTLFPVGRAMRANLFVYRQPGEEWTREFRRTPDDMLRRITPALSERIGPVHVGSSVVARPIDIVESRNHVRPGIVLLGDAFSTVCPITGFGMAKAINDAELLASHHLPAWLGSAGMGQGKIAAFYADPRKLGLDTRATADSLAGRRAISETAYWQVRRSAGHAYHRLRDAVLIRQAGLARKGLAPAAA